MKFICQHGVELWVFISLKTISIESQPTPENKKDTLFFLYKKLLKLLWFSISEFVKILVLFLLNAIILKAKFNYSF